MLTDVAAALLPVVLLIAFGFGLRRRRLLPDTFWPQAEWLAYFVLLPALFIYGLATADLGDVPIGRIFAVLIGAILATSALLLAARPWLGVDGAAFTSVFQGGIRFNNYVGVMIATGLYGAEGTALAALANAAIVPTVNILAVLAFSRYGMAAAGLGQVLWRLGTNPLLLASALGLALQLTGTGLPIGVSGALATLGQASLAIGLICVGAALMPAALGLHLRPIAASLLFKFLILPAVTLLAALAAGLSGMELVIVLTFHALPTATSSYILARQLGGDHALMANIIAVQTVLSAVTIPLAIVIATALG
ncbi:AEC family transporter [Pararhodobacter sp. SW119]|uniref:AEC family transporter n=1 Tax=Pararhodobacter sp. SW119 TaxID=2780075 RepID=UPI001AE0C681|nr:AEC family transporter [Pararhodobacter sp. SW119]